MQPQVLVSVLCVTYNHESYIRDCLEGFVNQKTEFPFEVVIHDDVSTDGTREILREYERKYPDLIRPIYQTVNQYSQGVDILKQMLLPHVRGKYIALCEGDDAWVSPDKLQKQVAFLEAHPECSAVISGAVMLDYTNGLQQTQVYPTESSRFVEMAEMICRGAAFPTASLVYRADAIREDIFRDLQLDFSDFTLMLNLAVHGKVYAFHEPFAMYRYSTPGSWTSRNKSDVHGRIKVRNSQAKVFDALNAYTGNVHQAATERALRIQDFEILLEQGRVEELKKPPFDQMYKVRFGPKAKIKKALRTAFPFLTQVKKWLKKQ